jgi:hypothetical protein
MSADGIGTFLSAATEPSNWSIRTDRRAGHGGLKFGRDLFEQAAAMQFNREEGLSVPG